MAARDSQDAVQDALRCAVADDAPISAESIRLAIEQHQQIPPATDVAIDPPDLREFDSLLQHPDMEVSHEDEHNPGGPSQDQGVGDDPAHRSEREGARREDEAGTDRTVPRQHPAYLLRPHEFAAADHPWEGVQPFPNGDYYIFLNTEMTEGIFGQLWEQTLCVIGEQMCATLGKRLGSWLAVVRQNGEPT
jgi:hypothetical protein